MSPDYEAEYNNRARVPEHPAIVAGWARDAAAYRDEVGSRFLRVPYGPSDRQAIDLFRPETKQVQTVVVFVHGGYWQAMDRSSFSHLARGLNAQGITVALPGYDLCPEVRVGEIVAQIREACRALATESPRLVVAGHSAGGHLAACMLATDWTKLDATLPHDFVQAAYAISGLFELKPLVSTSINKALELSEVEAERLSPLLWDAPRD
jgi:arylformamidase